MGRVPGVQKLRPSFIKYKKENHIHGLVSQLFCNKNIMTRGASVEGSSRIIFKTGKEGPKLLDFYTNVRAFSVLCYCSRSMIF